jgi:copper chaperone CopZ
MVKLTFKVEGMMCHRCEAHATEAVNAAVKAEKVTSSHEAGETVVICDDSVDVKVIENAITECGYKVTGVTSEPYKKRGFFSLFKK